MNEPEEVCESCGDAFSHCECGEECDNCGALVDDCRCDYSEGEDEPNDIDD